jgi:hypothetical protein
MAAGHVWKYCKGRLLKHYNLNNMYLLDQRPHAAGEVVSWLCVKPSTWLAWGQNDWGRSLRRFIMNESAIFIQIYQNPRWLPAAAVWAVGPSPADRAGITPLAKLQRADSVARAAGRHSYSQKMNLRVFTDFGFLSSEQPFTSTYRACYILF